MNRIPRLLALLPLALSISACAAEDDEDTAACVEGKCDDLDKPDKEIPATPCDGIMIDKSGRKNKKVAGRLNDDLAKQVFRAGDDCPSNFTDIMTKLKANDAKGDCKDDPGIATRFVSETAQLLNKGTSYRTVTTKQCGQRNEHEILFSMFGIAAGATKLPAAVEMIAFDETAGVFNYYVTEGGDEIQFMGNSKDMLKGTGSGGDRRCAGCHTGGGLIMKELESPWVHWEGDTTTPGVATLSTRHKELLGSQSDGINMEGVVRSGNDPWNDTRLAFIKANGTTADLLRPLFCTVEINLGSAGASKDVSGVPSKYMVSPEIGFPFVNAANTDYQAIISANDQKVGSSTKKDTFFAWTAPERSAADQEFVQKLVAKKIIDDNFVKDVLMVDFTRPIFSDDRCDLLEFAPSLTTTNKKAKNIREGFIKKLKAARPAAGTPAAELLANLEKKTDDSAARVDAFQTACTARDAIKVAVGTKQVSAFLKDMLAVNSLMKDTARELQVMEFAETMADDSQEVAAGSRLNPSTCEITADFVGVAGTALPTPPTPTPTPN